MTDFVVHPAFRNGTDNKFMLGEWDEEVSGFWVAKYEAGYQANTITNNNGTLSTTISNADDTVVYSDLYYTSYNINWTSNALEQDLSETGYSNERISYPVFLPLTYSYNNICIGDSYTLAGKIDIANNFYGLNSSTTDSHMMKNSEWGAVAYLAQSSYGRAGVEITINDYYTNTSSLFGSAITGLASSDGSQGHTQDLSNVAVSNVAAYNTTNGMKGSTTGNITGIYDLSGGLWEKIAGYIQNRNLTDGDSSGVLIGATSTANPDGYLTLSTRTYTVYPYNNGDDDSDLNYERYKELFISLSGTYGYGDAILETSVGERTTDSWNSDSSYYTNTPYSFFTRGGYYGNSFFAGLFSFHNSTGGAESNGGFRIVLVNE